MTYLIWQMLACLLVAFLLGLLLGWWLGRRKLQERLDRLDERWRLKMERCRANLEACRKDLEAAREEEPPAPDDDQGAAPMGLLGTSDGAAVTDATKPAAPVEPDDLKKVEGIGPKIEGLLNAAGIQTWAQLAGAEVSRLQSVLDDAGPRYRVHDPATWPRQAGLAADGKWEELEELQDRLKGGRDS